MAATGRRWFLLGVFVTALLGSGCNVLSLPFFIFGPEPKIEAKLHKLASKDKDEEVKVVILAYSGLETRSEFLRVDRDLSQLLAQSLKLGFEYNKEKVTVISLRKVEEYKQQHPDWHTMDLEDIGAHFKADYVIYLEIDPNALTLYEKGMNNAYYRGRATIDVRLVEVNPKEEGLGSKENMYTCVFPSESKPPLDSAGGHSSEFRQVFYRYMAEQLSWYFTSHPTNKEYSCR